MTKDNDANKMIVPRSAPSADLPSAPLSFGPRMDITYHLIENVKLSDQSLHRSLMTGSILRGCSFHNVDFSRCDLDGMRIENCFFERCDLQGADIRSTVLASCHFTGSKLDQALLTDCTVSGCTFEATSFCSAVVSNTSFFSCSMTDCSLRRASCTLDRFLACTFADMILGDCTFIYMIFKDCQFHATTINAESVGLIYGLTSGDLDSLQFIYLGEKQEKIAGEALAKTLLDSYEAHRWDIGIAIVRINLKLTSDAYALHDYIQKFIRDVRSGLVIKVEEVRFLMNVLHEMRAEKRLPLLSVIEVVESIAALLLDLGHQGRLLNDRGITELRILSSDLLTLMHEMLDEFEKNRLPAESTDFPVALRITLEEQPGQTISDLLNEITSASGFPVNERAQTLEFKHGSFLEIISTTLFAVLAFQMFLFLLNGCVIQITELKARVKALARKRAPKAYLSDSLQPRQVLPAHLASGFRNLFGYTLGLRWLADPKLHGLSLPNVKAMEIDRPSKKKKQTSPRTRSEEV